MGLGRCRWWYWNCSSNHLHSHVHQHTNLVTAAKSSGFGWGGGGRKGASCCRCRCRASPAVAVATTARDRRPEDLVANQLPWRQPSPPLSSSPCTSTFCCSSSRRLLRSLVSHPALPSPIVPHLQRFVFFPLVVLFTAAPPFFYPPLLYAFILIANVTGKKKCSSLFSTRFAKLQADECAYPPH